VDAFCRHRQTGYPLIQGVFSKTHDGCGFFLGFPLEFLPLIQGVFSKTHDRPMTWIFLPSSSPFNSRGLL